MEARPIMTKFIINKPEDNEFYIYRIPECSMFRLHKGDIITLRRYKRGLPSNDLEVWHARVACEPSLQINWSDAADTSRDAYDVSSVIPIQLVTVDIIKHKFV